MNPELEELLSKPTASVEDVSRVCFGLSRTGSYDAARRGDFATLRVGRLIRVPTMPLRRQLGLESPLYPQPGLDA
jgi:hypothetical protein